MNKYAAEKIASEYYNLGVQLALQESGLIKTAKPDAVTRRAQELAFERETSPINIVPYQHKPDIEDILNKYDASKEELGPILRRGQDAAKATYRFMDSLGDNNSPRAMNLSRNKARVPYRNESLGKQGNSLIL